MPNDQTLQRQRELERELDITDLRAVLDLPEGRRVFARLVRMAGVAGPSYAPGDALATAYNEGMRGIGLHILRMAGAAAPGYINDILMPKEETHDGYGRHDNGSGGTGR